VSERVESAERALQILALLLRADFAVGLTATQVSRELNILRIMKKLTYYGNG